MQVISKDAVKGFYFHAHLSLSNLASSETLSKSVYREKSHCVEEAPHGGKHSLATCALACMFALSQYVHKSMHMCRAHA